MNRWAAARGLADLDRIGWRGKDIPLLVRRGGREADGVVAHTDT
jgi:hypothetical protein